MALDLSKLLNVLKQNGRLSDNPDDENPDEVNQTFTGDRYSQPDSYSPSIIQPPQQTDEAPTDTPSTIVRPPVQAQADTADTPPSIIRKPDPIKDAYDQAFQTYQNVKNGPNPKVPKWANVLAIAGQTANDFFNNKNTPIQTLGAIKKGQQVADAQEGLDTATKAYQTNTNINNTNADNERADAQMKAAIARQAQTEADKKTAEQGRNQRLIASSKIFDPKSVEGQAQMKAAGWTPEQMAAAVSHDYTNPRVQHIGKDTFEYDKMTGAWKPSGLPPDEAKKLNPYEVTEDDAQGNQHVVATYYLNDAQAARLQQQKELQGQKLRAAKEMQDSRIGAATDKTTATHNFKIQDAAAHDANFARRAIGSIAVGAPKNATPEQITAKQHAYWQALSPDVQKQIPEPK